jgi:hypothetical protein
MNSRQFIYLLFITELILFGFWYAGSAVTAMFYWLPAWRGARLFLRGKVFKSMRYLK